MNCCIRLAAVITALLWCVGGFSAPQIGVDLKAEETTVLVHPSTGTFIQHCFTAKLDSGTNTISLLIDAEEINLQHVRLEPVDKASGVSVIEMQHPPATGGQFTWVLSSPGRTACRLRLTYPLKTLESRIQYTLTLDRPMTRLVLENHATLRNTGKAPLLGAAVHLAGLVVTADLPVGETVQRQMSSFEDIPCKVRLVYDNVRFKDSVMRMLHIPREDTGRFAKTALNSGAARVMSASTGLPIFLAETTIVYTPPHEPLELAIGAVTDIEVVRTRVKAEQVNVRNDVYRKIAVFDSDEEFEFEITNRRNAPVQLLIREKIADEWQMLRHSQPFVRTDAESIEFTVDLEPGETHKLGYTVRRLNLQP